MTHLGTWSVPKIRMLVPVALRISEIIAPPFPNRQPTWFDGTMSRAVTFKPLPEPESSPFSIEASKAFTKTRTTAFCAGEYCDSGFYRISSQLKPVNNTNKQSKQM